MKKKMKIIFFVMLISVLGVVDVQAAKNPYTQAGPYGTNCTWYAWKMANEKAGVTLPGFGNAKNWYRDAKNAGYTVGTTPKANSIIVWGDWTSYGHVGYVETVEGNILHVWDSTGPCIDEEDLEYRECMSNSVSEESDKVCKANAKRIACEYTISPSNYTITGYIYLDYAPKKTTSSSSNNTMKKEETATKPVVTKSSNANLSSIEVSSGTLEFTKEVFEYAIEVENEVDKITVSATLEDEKAKMTGTGDYELNVGLNKIKLIVTAEDSSIKEYVIQIIRKEKNEVEIELDVNNSQNSNQTEDVKTKKNPHKTMIVGFSVFFLILFILSFIMIFKKKNHNKMVEKSNSDDTL